MARIRIVDEWLRSPASAPTHYRSIMVVAERWAEQRVLMRAFAESRDQTRPTIVLHGAEIAIGPAGLDANGSWGLHVQPPVDGRAQELVEALELAARRLAGSKGNAPRLADESPPFERKPTNNWAPGTPRDVPEAPSTSALWDPQVAASQVGALPVQGSPPPGHGPPPPAPPGHGPPPPAPPGHGPPPPAQAAPPPQAAPPAQAAPPGHAPPPHAPPPHAPHPHSPYYPAAGAYPGASYPAHPHAGPGVATVFSPQQATQVPAPMAVSVPQLPSAAPVSAMPPIDYLASGPIASDPGMDVVPSSGSLRRTPVPVSGERRRRATGAHPVGKAAPGGKQTALGYSSGAGAQSAIIRLGLRPVAASRLGRLVDRIVPPDFQITAVEREVLNALGERGVLSARAIGEMIGVIDGVTWMERLIEKLERHGLDIVAPGAPDGSDPTYTLRR